MEIFARAGCEKVRDCEEIRLTGTFLRFGLIFLSFFLCLLDI